MLAFGALVATVIVDVPESFLFDVDVAGTLGVWVAWGGWVVFAVGTMLTFTPRSHGLHGLESWLGGHPIQGYQGLGDMVALFTALAVGMLVAAAAVPPLGHDPGRRGPHAAAQHGGALTPGGEAVSLVEARLRLIAAAYGFANARISVLPTMVTVALGDGESAGVRTIDSLRQLRLDQASEVIALDRRAEAAELALADALAEPERILAEPARFGTVAFVTSHAVLTVGIGLLIHPAAVELWV